MVTGRKEDVGAAKREILSAAEHFSQIRAQRKNNLNGSLAPGPNSNIPGEDPYANCTSSSWQGADDALSHLGLLSLDVVRGGYRHTRGGFRELQVCRGCLISCCNAPPLGTHVMRRLPSFPVVYRCQIKVLRCSNLLGILGEKGLATADLVEDLYELG